MTDFLSGFVPIIYNEDIVIPSILWEKGSNKLLIAIHGDQSNKEDAIIKILAQNAIDKDYQVLSFDLPEHGERMNNDYEYNPQNCVSDLIAIYNYATSLAFEIFLFACSIGAYFSLLAYNQFNINNSLFLSPVVNMERIIQNMMNGFPVSEQKLKREKQISLPTGKVLDWNYYTYVKQYPINFDWTFPANILIGSKDTVSEKEFVDTFSRKYNAKLTELEDGEHYFHTLEQLIFFEKWLNDSLWNCVGCYFFIQYRTISSSSKSLISDNLISLFTFMFFHVSLNTSSPPSAFSFVFTFTCFFLVKKLMLVALSITTPPLLES